MGQLQVEGLVSNAIDIERQVAGEIELAKVRSERMQDVLIDTGSVLLRLPADVIARLGVPVDREVNVETAAGPSTMRLFRQVRLEVVGRHGIFEFLETPVGAIPLLGPCRWKCWVLSRN